MQCPTCIKQELEPSYFCSQACFKANWATHKTKHKVVTQWFETPPEFASFKFTGIASDSHSYLFPRRPPTWQVKLQTSGTSTH
jgi:methionyl aminopeptidase